MWTVPNHQQIDSDRSEGSIRKPMQLRITVGRALRGSVGTLPIAWTGKQWAPFEKIENHTCFSIVIIKLSVYPNPQPPRAISSYPCLCSSSFTPLMIGVMETNFQPSFAILLIS